MALVLKKDMVNSYINTNLVVSNPTEAKLTYSGTDAGTIMTFPAQGEFTEPVQLALVGKPFCNFAEACGPKGTMTAQMILDQFGTQGIDQAMAETLADDFAIFMGNYVVIPENVVIAITCKPIAGIHVLEKPVPQPEVIDHVPTV